MNDRKPYRMAPQVAEVLLAKEGKFAWLYALEQMADCGGAANTYAMWQSVLDELDKLKEKQNASTSELRATEEDNSN